MKFPWQRGTPHTHPLPGLELRTQKGGHLLQPADPLLDLRSCKLDLMGKTLANLDHLDEKNWVFFWEHLSRKPYWVFRCRFFS